MSVGRSVSSNRWWALALAAAAVSSSYYEDDIIGPVADLLQQQRGFSQMQPGVLNGVISIPNVALALIGGLGICGVLLWRRESGGLGHGLEVALKVGVGAAG